MERLFSQPQLGLDDQVVLDEIREIRGKLASVLRAPKRWQGALRRSAQARAIQGSNSIEGYTVTDADAAAAVDDEPPLTADQKTWAEIIGYRRVLTYVLQVAAEPAFDIDESVLKSMHFMLLEHELMKSPGRYRTGPIYVQDDRAQRVVYEGPDALLVPALMKALVKDLADVSGDALVRAAMAHLNLVLIHPFRDGNGRMARAVQTMVLAQDRVVEPMFSSVEEWLGHNTDDYYAVLAATAGGGWNPDRDCRYWVQFILRAHHMQAQTVARRFEEATRQWELIDELVASHGLPDRAADAMFDAVLGIRITRPTYVKRTGIEERTATRDLARLVELGLLVGSGQTRGRTYSAGAPLVRLRNELVHSRAPIEDPYPDLIAEIRVMASAAANADGTR